MTNPHDKAIEAAAKALWELADDEVGWEASKADPKMEPQIEWTLESIRAAITAYERAMWRPIEEAPLLSEHEKVLIIGGRYKRIALKLSDGEWWKSQKGKIAGIPTHFRPLPPVPEGE